MDISIDHDKCIGAGQCALIAPEVFDQRVEDGLSVLLVEDPGADQYEAVREAAEMCPLGAITTAGAARPRD
ncbi:MULTISPECIES: ferredoxin [Streptomyces]|uniref:Ferredoxin n=2 Tax=Streptomyces albus TaxID=1888 RepID=A0A0B5EG73_STRA4|nr:ferredoxin [Streptomyces sp. SCSIO ZS0520]AJE81053.1 SalE [Streptomyces albus]AOU75365.1 SalE [Streptomyces albus]AYN31172.1 ferredoxin [Streptomyces albus]